MEGDMRAAPVASYPPVQHEEKPNAAASEGRAKKGEGKRHRKSKGGKHARGQSYGGPLMHKQPMQLEPWELGLWIPGVGYVIDNLGTYEGQLGHQCGGKGDDRRGSLHARTASFESGLPQLSKSERMIERRRRRREEQRRNRSKSNNSNNSSDAVSHSTPTSCSAQDETSSHASSSPTLSYSSTPSTGVSTAMHSRSSSGIMLSQVDSLNSRLPPEVLAGLLSMAAWCDLPPFRCMRDRVTALEISPCHWDAGSVLCIGWRLCARCE